MVIVAGVLWWQAGVHCGRHDANFKAEEKKADRMLRSFVMTQDLDYLRRNAIDLHKAYWEVKKEDSKEGLRNAWVMGACGVVLLGMAGSYLVGGRKRKV